MSEFFSLFGDLVVAAVLLGLVALVAIASRAGVLPGWSFPVAIGAAAGAFGFHIFRSRMLRRYEAEARALKESIQRREEVIADLTRDHENARREAAAARARLDERLAEMEVRYLEYETTSRARREALRTLPIDEVDRMFRESLERRRVAAGGDP